MQILQVNNLCKTYGESAVRVDALKNVSFSLNKGEFCAVVGESGSGKSTLLNLIGALDFPTEGNILIDGQNLFSMNEEQNIIFPLLLDYRKPNPNALNELLSLLDLQDRRHHLPNQLSGGQKQRVAIGRALITDPKLILADEQQSGRLCGQSAARVRRLSDGSGRNGQNGRRLSR